MAQRKISRFFVWIIMGLLFFGLIGFGATGLSGTVRTLGTVGDKQIPVQQYARELTDQIRAFEAQTGQPLSFAQAQSFGLPQLVLGQVVAVRTLDNEAAQLGISASDARVAQQVLQTPAFQGINGQFDREAYRFTLDRAGLSESEFEASLRDDLARSLLQGAVVGGVPAPDAYVDALVRYIGESRDVTWAVLDADALQAPLPDPSDEELQALYDASPDTYTVPEIREITFAWLTPEMIQDEVTIDEEALRQLYQDRIDEFVQGERRLVERLVFPDAAAAEAAKARVDAGEADFPTLVQERGLDLADADMGDVAQEEIGAAGDAVFAATPGEVVGPIDTSLGPALFRINAVLAAEETTFEEARPALREELAAARARRVIEDSRDALSDLLAGGATVEDLAESSEMQLGTIDWSEGDTASIAAYDAFREAASTATEGAFPELLELADGGLFALRLDALRPPERQPLNEVRDQVAADWRAQASVDALMAQAETLAAQIRDGADFAAAGLDAQQEENLTRRAFVAGTPGDFVAQVFEMEPGAVQVIAGEDRVLIARMEAVADPDPADPGVAAERQAVAERAAAGIAQDIFDSYTRAVQEQTEIRIDDAAVNAVHSQFQ